MRRTNFRFPVTTLAGSKVKNILEILDEHHVEPKYRRKFIFSCIAAGILEPFNLAERILWQKRIREYRLTAPPVFIIGFWRSGTTLLHNLLCQDPEAAYTTTFQTVFPNLGLSQSWWLKPVINHLLPARRPFDNVSMDMDFPQEEDFGLMNIQPSTIYKFFLFPAEFNRIIDQDLFTGSLPEEKISQWKEAYHEMVAKAVYNTGGTRYIGKNPCHLTRTGLLKEMFPDAKFIFIHRHPYKVIESLYHFILSIFPGVQLQDVPPDFSRKQVVRLYKIAMDAYFADREHIPASDLIELKMQDFIADIPGHLNEIYEKFRLGNYSSVSARMDKYLTGNPCPEHLSNPPTQETIRLVDQYCPDIMEKLGYCGTPLVVPGPAKDKVHRYQDAVKKGDQVIKKHKANKKVNSII
ncbi:MAG: sulfotransferase [Bacteroidetes bacterium]|nr:sulfotransferase [Bacteroidota bacterium]